MGNLVVVGFAVIGALFVLNRVGRVIEDWFIDRELATSPPEGEGGG